MGEYGICVGQGWRDLQWEEIIVGILGCCPPSVLGVGEGGMRDYRWGVVYFWSLLRACQKEGFLPLPQSGLGRNGLP